MRRWLGAVIVAVVVATLVAEDELPQQDPNAPFEIEPPLLIQSRERDGSIPDPPGTSAAVDVDLAKLESDLSRAEKRAESGERLYKAGIIAKVDAEQRTLKVVQLKSAIAELRLQRAKAEAEEASRPEADSRLAEAAEAARRASDERHRAELEQALRNLQRQQKLLALGSGRKADVNRAEHKLAELKQAQD